MPLHRNGVVHAKLHEVYQTSRRKDAKSTISLNVVVPEALEKQAEKFMKQMIKSYEKRFKEFIDDQDGLN